MLKLKPRKTVDDWMKLPEGTLAELIGGEIFMTPAPVPDHQRIVLRLATALQAHVMPRGLGEALVSPIDVYLPSGDIVQPDILFVSMTQAGIVQDAVRGVPTLVVEVLSPGRPERDRLAKRDLYARNGVAEYWIVDPETRTVEAYRLDSGSYRQPALFEAGDNLTSTLVPGLSIPGASIFPSN